MEAIYLCRDAATIARVYAEKQHAALAARVHLPADPARSMDDPRLAEAEAVFSTWGMLPCTAEEIRARLPRLKYVFYAAGSVQYFARPFLECGVRVFSAWQANAVPVAQYTFAQIILALKGYYTVQARTRASRADAAALFQHYPGAFDARVGLLGCGAIGSRLAGLLQQLDVEVWVYDPFLSEARAAALGVRRASLEEVFAGCDVISNHLANLPETVGIIRREHLLSMRPYATFINTGRGPQLDESDLREALTAVPTRTALLDVLTDEANSDASPLNALPNCFITPHIAGSSGYEVRRMADYMVEALDRVLAGRPCDYEVTPAMLQTMA